MLLLIINDIHLCENTDHVNTIFSTGPRAIHLLRACDLP